MVIAEKTLTSAPSALSMSRKRPDPDCLHRTRTLWWTYGRKLRRPPRRDLRHHGRPSHPAQPGKTMKDGWPSKPKRPPDSLPSCPQSSPKPSAAKRSPA